MFYNKLFYYKFYNKKYILLISKKKIEIKNSLKN